MECAERLTMGVKRGSQIRTARPIDRVGSQSWLFNVLHVMTPSVGWVTQDRTSYYCNTVLWLRFSYCYLPFIFLA